MKAKKGRSLTHKILAAHLIDEKLATDVTKPDTILRPESAQLF